jgi:hypothetical protein
MLKVFSIENKVNIQLFVDITFRLESNATYLARSAKGAKLDSYDKL